MRRLRTYILTLAIIVPALVSCSGIDIGDMKDDYVTLCLNTPRIAADTDTKSMPIDGEFFPWQSRTHAVQTGNTPYTDYSVGLWICDGGTLEPHMPEHKNNSLVIRAQHNVINGKNTWVWLKSNATYSPSVRLGKSIDIHAYHPFVTTDSFTPKNVPFTTTEQKDWMWADVTINNDENHSVDFKFYHAMTCLEIRLSTLFTSSIKLTNITLSDVKGKLCSAGNMNIKDGSLTYTEDQQSLTIKGNNKNDNLIPLHSNDNSSYQSFCFLMPEKSFEENDLTLSFKFNNISGRATYTIPSTFTDSNGSENTINTFKTGKKYILNLVVNNELLITPLSFEQVEWTSTDINLII